MSLGGVRGIGELIDLREIRELPGSERPIRAPLNNGGYWGVDL